MSHSGRSDSKMGHIQTSLLRIAMLHMVTMQCMYMCEVLWDEITSAQVLDAHTYGIYLMHYMMRVLYHMMNCMTYMITHLTAKAKKSRTAVA